MRRYRFCGLVVALFFALAGVLQAQEGAQGLYDRAWQAWQGIKDYTCILSSYNRLGDKEEYRTYEYWYLKPGYVRMKVIKGKGKGGEAFYDPHRHKVRGHKGGFFSFVVLTLEPTDKRVTSIRGARVDETTFGYILSQLKPYIDHGQCEVAQGNFVTVSCKSPVPYHGDIFSEKVVFNNQLFPVVWERYGKDGTLLYRLECKDVRINKGLTYEEISKGLAFKGGK